MKIGVLLSGCGVYDGSEIHEAVSVLLALDKLGAEVQCIAPDIDQHHVVNHIDGSEMEQTRNVLVEAARIARGQIKPASEIKADDLDGLAMPGGFGAAKNLSTWALAGPDGAIEPETKRLLQEMVAAKKPIASLCISPTVLAKAFQDTDTSLKLTVGTTEAVSPYDIPAINAGLESTGASVAAAHVNEIVVDEDHKIITSPCYMMEASIAQIYEGAEKAMTQLVELVKAA